MAAEPTERDSLEELTRRLAELEAGRRKAPRLLDRMMSRLGEAEIAIGTLIFAFTPFDWVSAILTTTGGVTCAYERFIREPRQERDEIDRNRRIDLLRSEIDRLRRR